MTIISTERINSANNIHELTGLIKSYNFLSPYNVIATIKKAESLTDKETIKKTDLLSVMNLKAQWDKLSPNQALIVQKFYRSHNKDLEFTHLSSKILKIENNSQNDELEDKKLCNRLNGFIVDNLNGANRFLETVADEMQNLNQIHWAVIGGKLHQIAKSRNATHISIKDKVKAILQRLENASLFSFGPGQIAQLFGGVAPFLDQNDVLLKAKLCNKIQDSLGAFKKNELIMVLETIRKAPGKFPDLYAHFLKHCVSAQQPFPFSQHPDLLAILFQGWASNGRSNDVSLLLEEFFKTESNFSIVNKMQVLESLSTHISMYPKSDHLNFLPCIEGIMKSFRELLESDNGAFTPRQLSSLQIHLSEIRYFDPIWNNLALKSIHFCGPLWEKILFISGLSKLGALNQNCGQDFKNEIFETAREYLRPENSYLHQRYPADLCMLAKALMMLLESNENLVKTLVWPLIEIASKQNLDPKDIHRLYQTSILSKYENANPQWEQIKAGEAAPSITQLEIEKLIRDRLQKYNGYQIVTEAPFKGTHIDIAIYGLSKDEMPIFIEADGPTHYALNSLKESQLIPVGSTYFKQRLIRESGAHLVVIPITGWKNCDKEAKIEKAVAEILSYS